MDPMEEARLKMERGPAASSHVIKPSRLMLKMFVAGAALGSMVGGATPTLRVTTPLIIGSFFALVGFASCNLTCIDDDDTKIPCRELRYRWDRLAEAQAARLKQQPSSTQ